MKFYNKNIQLDIKVINDIEKNTTESTRTLIIGLGYDSKMWYNLNPNTYFVENNEEYIKLNEKDIPLNNIIKYNYDKNINVYNSFNLDDNKLLDYNIPKKLLELGPFDIILIDGPEGWNGESPGRLIPCYWAMKYLSKNSIIYIDDANRKLESYCIDRFFKDNEKKYFQQRNGCCKINTKFKKQIFQ